MPFIPLHTHGTYELTVVAAGGWLAFIYLVYIVVSNIGTPPGKLGATEGAWESICWAVGYLGRCVLSEITTWDRPMFYRRGLGWAAWQVKVLAREVNHWADHWGERPLF